MATKNVRVHFAVVGSGDFPVDMLRYDRCWPEREQDSAHLATSRHAERAQRRVELQGLEGAPTRGRWLSFGWTVVEASVRVVKL